MTDFKNNHQQAQLDDRQARALALSVDQSFIVQAPAGSGKTGLLVYRMLNLLATVDKPEQVLALTFTRKATSEMRHRLVELLNKADAGDQSDNEFEQHGIELAKRVIEQSERKDWQLLDTPNQVQILTIDAFCAKLTADMPWLSRLGDKPRTTDQAEQHYRAAIEQLFKQLLGTESQLTTALKTVLLELDFDYAKVRRLFSAMLSKRDQWLRHLLQNDITQLRPSLETSWREISEEQMQSLQQMLPENTIEQLVNIAYKAASFMQDSSSPLGIFNEPSHSKKLSLEQWRALQFILLTKDTKGFRKRLDKNCGFPASEKVLKAEMQGLLNEFVDDHALLTALQQLSILPDTHFSDDDWQQIIALEQVLKALAAFLQLRFRAAGECDHSEVSQRANLALQELDAPTDLALRIDYQLQHILVDEFQDTSYSQLELLKKLTAGWQSAGIGGGQSLFLVGDPMQSIYRFREADVSLFLQVANNANSKVFSNIDIKPLQLSQNFRSASGLVDWFNRTFEDSFPSQNNVLSGAISYAQAQSTKKLHSSVQYHLATSKDHEADLVVKAIKSALLELPDKQSKIALLVRSRTHLKALLPAISNAGITYSGVDIQPLKETPAVIDVVSLAKAICRLDDRISWLALLRGPWCGLSLLDIKALLPRQDIPVWNQLKNQTFNETLNQASRQRLKRFADVMAQAIEQRQQVPLHSLTRWTWQALGGQTTLFEAQLEDVQAVFGLLEKLQKGGDLPALSDLDTALDRLYAQPAQQSSSQLIVSTIHKAKGLQYDTVILPSLNSPSKSNEKDLLMWAEHTNQSGQARLLLAPIRLQEGLGSHFDYLRALDKQRSSNEMIRLMYVACTRAERQVILLACGQFDEQSKSIKTPPASSLLGTVWNALENHFENSVNNSQDQAQNLNKTDDGGISQTLHRLKDSFKVNYPASVQWQAPQQLASQQIKNNDDEAIEYQWATEVATAVGIILHDWLEFNSQQLFTTDVDDVLLKQWRTELTALRVPSSRQKWALQRLTKSIEAMKNDPHAIFIFKDYKEQANEYTISCVENGILNTYRLDRTFVDEKDTRWIVDYKTTFTRAENIGEFIDQQIVERHAAQLNKYASLVSQLETRPIKLLVYFPMLGEMRSWDYQSND